MEELITRFASLYRGQTRGFGKTVVTFAEAGKKASSKSWFEKQDITEQEYENHIKGVQGLGIAPINDEDRCFFCTIDVDSYAGNGPVEFAKRLKELPCVVLRSKSGGTHISFFFRYSIPAALAKSRLEELAGSLGISGSEVFPKQSKILTEDGDWGSWINLPYFDQEFTTRYAVDAEGKGLTLAEFLDAAESKLLSEDEFAALEFESPTSELFVDGPPCLQTLLANGFVEGTRNRGLFNVGVYLRKAFPEDWETKLDEYNELIMDPALPANEVKALKKSLNKKDYHYQCNQEPIKSFCNRAACIKRKFGVRGGAGGDPADLPVMGGLVKVSGVPPVWFLDVEGSRIGPLETDELLGQARFRRVCAERVNMFPPKVSDGVWQLLIQTLLASCTTIETPDTMQSEGMLWSYLMFFLMKVSKADTPDELIAGRKPWTDGEGHIYFTLEAFRAYLDRVRFRDVPTSKIIAILRGRGCEFHKLKTSGGVQLDVLRLLESQVTPFTEQLGMPAEKQELPF